MTGTAATEGVEFSNIYNLTVTVVPANRTVARTDNPDVVFRCVCVMCVCGEGAACALVCGAFVFLCGGLCVFLWLRIGVLDGKADGILSPSYGQSLAVPGWIWGSPAKWCTLRGPAGPQGAACRAPWPLPGPEPRRTGTRRPAPPPATSLTAAPAPRGPVCRSNESGKWRAVVQEVRRMHKTGRPVLVGTTSVEKSEQISALLAEDGIPFQARCGLGQATCCPPSPRALEGACSSLREAAGRSSRAVADSRRRAPPRALRSVHRSIPWAGGVADGAGRCRVPQVLNAKPENVERESEIVAQSGRRGAVTIATNMAGRGTDILLGGNPGAQAGRAAAGAGHGLHLVLWGAAQADPPC
jgi:hypothetical protein